MELQSNMEELRSGLAELAKVYEGLSSRLSSLTEKATENIFIFPFIKHLGYDAADPNAVEFEYDIGKTYKGSGKVDCVLKDQEGRRIIFVECKKISESLKKNHYDQIKFYFNSKPAVKFAILTNGYEYRFYTDLDHANVLDERPFLSFNLETDTDKYLDHLSKFTKQNFNASDAHSLASTLSYLPKTLEYLEGQIKNPDDRFVKFIAKEVVGTAKKSVCNEIKAILPAVFNELPRGKDAKNRKVVDPPIPEPDSPKPVFVNIFDAGSPTKKKLNCYIFDGEEHTGKVTDMFVYVFENLFQRDKDQVLNFKGSPVSQSLPKRHHRKLADGYFLSTNSNNEDKFRKLKDALTAFGLEDALYVKLTDGK